MDLPSGDEDQLTVLAARDRNIVSVLVDAFRQTHFNKVIRLDVVLELGEATVLQRAEAVIANAEELAPDLSNPVALGVILPVEQRFVSVTGVVAAPQVEDVDCGLRLPEDEFGREFDFSLDSGHCLAVEKSVELLQFRLLCCVQEGEDFCHAADRTSHDQAQTSPLALDQRI